MKLTVFFALFFNMAQGVCIEFGSFKLSGLYSDSPTIVQCKCNVSVHSRLFVMLFSSFFLAHCLSSIWRQKKRRWCEHMWVGGIKGHTGKNPSDTELINDRERVVSQKKFARLPFRWCVKWLLLYLWAREWNLNLF